MHAHLQGGVADRPDPHSPQPHHGMTDGVAHVAHLPGLAFVDRNRQQRLVGSRAQAALQHAHHRRSRALALDAHAAAHPVQALLGRLAPDARVVLPLHLVLRVEQAFGQRPVVGEEQQAFRVVVQAAHRVHVFAHLRQQVEDGRPVLRVLPRGDVAARLVQQDVAVARGHMDPLAVDADVVTACLGPRAQLHDGDAVHRDAPLGDERLRGAPRRHARRREDLLKPVAALLVSHLVFVFPNP